VEVDMARKGFVVDEGLYTRGTHYYYNYGNPWTNVYIDLSGSFVRIKPDSKDGDFKTPLQYAVVRQSCSGRTKYDRTDSYTTHIDRGSPPNYHWLLDSAHTKFIWEPGENQNTAGAYVYVDSPGIDNAIDQMYSKIAKEDFSMGQDVAELIQTVDHLSTSVKLAGNLLLDVKRGNFSKAIRRVFTRKEAHARKHKDPSLALHPKMTKRRFKTLGVDGRWLEAQFAIIPLLTSVDDYAKMAVFGLDKYEPLMIYKGKYNQKITQALYKTGTTNGPIKFRGSMEVTHRVKSVFKIIDPSLVALKKLGVINAPKILWELVPFSFVVDWILPIGKALALITALVGQTFVSCYKSVRVIGTRGYTEEYFNSNKTRRWQNIHDIAVNGYSRSVIQAIPVWRPQIKSPFSWWHAVTSGPLISKLAH